MNETPTIDVHIVGSRETPGGMGEPGTSAIAPALANAIFAASGKRIRSFPFATRPRVRPKRLRVAARVWLLVAALVLVSCGTLPMRPDLPYSPALPPSSDSTLVRIAAASVGEPR